ncbi:zinc-dependent alcohol dehydrogenase family protein [Variovorax paradoxus]|uniref:Zinc-type alcohol dehydrogenase-like protein n=1 Tax=Variovorax paradoxus TaxID=34073 RepID=A0A679IX75_VARPD|nr:Zinc-type alcohol dehydrogenase-like protein [Variovorax paradoxus]
MTNSSTSPRTMRAAVLDAAGQPFRIARLDRPVAAAGEVLVRIHASGVNPLDTKIRAGQAAHAQQPLPAVLGMDLAGVVEAVGPGVTKFRRGDEVYGMAGGIGGLQGTLADYAAVDADLLALKPHNLGMREAAGLPLVFITAWEGLVDRAKTQAGQKVLVHGGAGGVGHMAVQLAVSLGAEVFATGAPSHADTIRRFGATPIDYTATTVDEYVARYTAGEGFDVVYDTVGGAVLDASFSAARRYGGHVVSCLGWGTHKLAPLSFRAATYSGVFTLLPMITGRGRAHHGEILEAATRLAEAGRLAPLMDARRFSLEEATSAHEAVEAGTARGRVVVGVSA